MNDIIHGIGACDSEVELYALCQEFIDKCGYRYFSVFKHPEEYNHSIFEITLISNWPVSLIKAYDRSELLKDSSFSAHPKTTGNPFLWTARDMYNSQDQAKASEGQQLFSKTGMLRGVVFSTKTDEDLHGFVIFTGDKDLKNEADFDQLQSLAEVLFSKTLSISTSIEKTDSKLSKREHECLLWTSEGKTSYEIGKILGLSENTINNYLVTVGRKLGAVNRPHMVGIALRRGFIK